MEEHTIHKRKDYSVNQTASQTTTLPDLSLEVACEHNFHGKTDCHEGLGWALVEYHCPRCSRHRRLIICKKYWDSMNSGLFIGRCQDCRTRNDPKSTHRLIHVVRP